MYHPINVGANVVMVEGYSDTEMLVVRGIEEMHTNAVNAEADVYYNNSAHTFYQVHAKATIRTAPSPSLYLVPYLQCLLFVGVVCC